jgi:hypothetical protein
LTEISTVHRKRCAQVYDLHDYSLKILWPSLAVIDAWKSDYRGDAYKLMLRVIDEVHQSSETTNYAKLVPVAQSSGTGKSKTVDKIATERILFPIILVCKV